VNDRQEKHPESAYYLDWNEDRKRRRISVGADAAAAYNSRARKQRELDAIAAGLIISNPSKTTPASESAPRQTISLKKFNLADKEKHGGDIASP
jgi:hypothetical protein